MWMIVVFLILLGLAVPVRAAGEWPMVRYDGWNSCTQPTPGAITSPRVLWRYFLGKSRTPWVVLEDVDGDGQLEMLTPGPDSLVCTDSTGQVKWASGAGRVVSILDVDDDGRKEIITGAGQILSGKDGKVLWQHSGHGVADYRILVGKWLPEVKGLQLATVATVAGLGDIAYLYAFDEGAAQGRLLWQQQICDPSRVTWCNCIIGDVDGDGVNEMVTGVGYGAIVQDCRDGKIEVDLKFSEDYGRWRHYGIMQLADVDKDGVPEVVFLDDLISLQLSVFKVAPGTPRELWCQFFGWVLPYGEKYLRVSSSSLGDVDGDGNLELTVSVLLDKAHIAWRTHVYDALTGTLKYDLPGLYLQQVQKLSPAQRRPYVIASHESSIIPRDFADVEIGVIENGQWKRLWQAQNARLEAERTYPYVGLPRYPENTVGRNANERQPYLADWDGDGTMDLLFAFADPGDTRAGRFEVVGPDAHGDFQTKQTIPLPQDPELRAAGVGEIVKKGDLEILVSDREGQLRRLSRTGEELARWDAGARFSARPVVADLTGQGENLILIEKAHGTVVALDARHLLAVGNGRRAAPITSSVGENGTPVPDYQQPQVVWEHRGWGFEFGLAAADFRGDGTQLAAFAAEAAQQGLSGVVAVDARGDIIWQTPLPPIVPHLNLKTVRGWMPGRFAPDRQQGADLYVCAWDTPPVGAGNWDHSFALDGRTGKILWRNDGQDPAIALHSLGPGVLPALYDVNGDGLDDILMISQEIYVILNGADGNFLRPPIGAGFVGAKSWTAYGSIGLAWLTGQEKPDVIYRPGSGVEAVFNLQDEKPLWTFDPTSGGFAVVADFDGCGKPELAGNRGGVLTFLDPVSGQGKYQLTEPRYAPQEMCVCDINGDGKPEIVAASGSVVFAAQVADGQVRVVWTCDLGAPLGAPLVADVNGDGQCEVLVCTNDGQLCAVGP